MSKGLVAFNDVALCGAVDAAHNHLPGLLSFLGNRLLGTSWARAFGWRAASRWGLRNAPRVSILLFVLATVRTVQPPSLRWHK